MKTLITYYPFGDNQHDNNTTQTDTPTSDENQSNTGSATSNSGAESNSKEVLKDTVYEIHGPNNSKTYKLHLNQSSQADRKRVTDSLDKEGVLNRN